jgi:putative DNA primase/helicase
MANDIIPTSEENIETLKTRSIENATGIDFEYKEGDKAKAKIIKANMNNPIILAMYLLEESSSIIRTGSDSSNALYKYNGKCYDCMTSSDIDKVVLDFMIKYDITKAWSKLSHILRALRVHDSVKVVNELNPNRDLINLKNGVLNVKTKEFTKHSPDYFFDHCLEVEYDKDAKNCPVFINFLNSTFSKDTEVIENAIRLGGYLLDSSGKAEKFFLFDGNGGNGKSVLIDTYTMFFPERFSRPLVTSISLDTLSKEGFEKTDLIHSRFNQCAETKKGYYDAEYLKRMVSGDPITVSRKNLEPYTFRYQGKIIIGCNGLPSFTDTSDGISRRMLIFKFNNQYKEKHEIESMRGNKKNVFLLDKSLRDKIKSEASSILNLFIEGLIRLKEDDYKFINARSSVEAIGQVKNDSDSARQFLEENYDYDEKSIISIDEIFYHYREWYRNNIHESNLKFRMNEMAKRIKDVFRIESSGRHFFFDQALGKKVRRTSYNLKLVEYESEEIETKSFDELTEMLKNEDKKSLGI